MFQKLSLATPGRCCCGWRRRAPTFPYPSDGRMLTSFESTPATRKGPYSQRMQLRKHASDPARSVIRKSVRATMTGSRQNCQDVRSSRRSAEVL